MCVIGYYSIGIRYIRADFLFSEADTVLFLGDYEHNPDQEV